ncbi:MAG: LysM peptidoglycan-binding domain-containing protein [Caulobacterales bacterium]|nr:LysM peptidoglycan-binding domain-containing protein [Caulobacterales bacterium]
MLTDMFRRALMLIAPLALGACATWDARAPLGGEAPRSLNRHVAGLERTQPARTPVAGRLALAAAEADCRSRPGPQKMNRPYVFSPCSHGGTAFDGRRMAKAVAAPAGWARDRFTGAEKELAGAPADEASDTGPIDLMAGSARGEAAARPASAGEAERYVVQRGDTLWDIAQDHYGDGRRFAAVYQANRGVIDGPDLIVPGQVLTLPAAAG